MFGIPWLSPAILGAIISAVVGIIVDILKTLPPNAKLAAIMADCKGVLDDLFLAKAELPADWQKLITAIQAAINIHTGTGT